MSNLKFFIKSTYNGETEIKTMSKYRTMIRDIIKIQREKYFWLILIFHWIVYKNIKKVKNKLIVYDIDRVCNIIVDKRRIMLYEYICILFANRG